MPFNVMDEQQHYRIWVRLSEKAGFVSGPTYTADAAIRELKAQEDKSCFMMIDDEGTMHFTPFTSIYDIQLVETEAEE